MGRGPLPALQIICFPVDGAADQPVVADDVDDVHGVSPEVTWAGGKHGTCRGFLNRVFLLVRPEMELEMSKIETTRMSAKGQVVIPEGIRKRLGLHAGERFVVVGADDTVILKVLGPPQMKDFDALISEARTQARAAGLQRSEIDAAVRRARSRR
mgnify:FL=1